MGRLKRLGEVVKSPADKKEYRALKLKSDLHVLLISEQADDSGSDCDETMTNEGDDQSTDSEETTESDDESPNTISAAAMCVNVGGFHEPSEIGGLAHFCEHMLFMGSQKYPDENEFSSFVSSFSGSDNAHTDTDKTVFVFDISPSKFEEALDIWSQFFISPLMKESSVDREMEAVNAEFYDFKSDDTSRKYHIVQECLAKENHPLKNFMLGNTRSLKTDLTETTAYEALHAWYKNNYSPKWMNLVLQSTHTLDELEKIVLAKFASIPDGKLQTPLNEPDYRINGFEKNLPKLIYCIPINDLNEIDIAFHLPPQKKHYRVKPCHYLGWLIGHEGEGSILSLLKKQDLAHEIYAGNCGDGQEDNNYLTTFSINVRLTEKGLEYWDKVVKIIYDYIHMLKTLPLSEEKRIFEEIQNIENTNWNSQEEQESYKNVEDICENMMLYKPEDWLRGAVLLLDYDSEVIRNCLNNMTISNCFIILSSKSFLSKENVVFKEEKWMGAKYSVSDIPSNLLDNWKNVTGNPSLSIPQPNKYLAENTALKLDEPSREWKCLQKVSETELGELWYKADSLFDLPRGFIILLIRSKHFRANPKNEAIFDFFPFLLVRMMSEIAYDAETADLHYSFDADSFGLKIQISGLNDKLPQLYDEVLNQVANCAPKQIEFESLKSQFLENYSIYLKQPENLARDIRLTLMENTKWACVSKIKEFESVTLEDCISFLQNIKAECWLQMQVEGNFYQSEAEEMFKKTFDTLDVQSKHRDARIRTLEIPALPTLIKIQNLNEDDQRSEFVTYWQTGPMNIKEYTSHDLLITIMEEPCFDYLRTKKTLGYTVFPLCRVTYGIIGSTITVRSQLDKFTVEDVKLCVDEFLIEFKQLLNNMTPDKFDEHRHGLIESKASQDNKLKQVVQRNYGEISGEEYRFDRLEIEIKFLKELKKEDVINCFEASICSNTRNMILAIEGYRLASGNGLNNVHLSPGDAFAGFNVVEDLDKFKNDGTFFPFSRLNND